MTFSVLFIAHYLQRNLMLNIDIHKGITALKAITVAPFES